MGTYLVGSYSIDTDPFELFEVGTYSGLGAFDDDDNDVGLYGWYEPKPKVDVKQRF